MHYAHINLWRIGDTEPTYEMIGAPGARIARVRVMLSEAWTASESSLARAVEFFQEWTPDLRPRSTVTGCTRAMVPPPNDPACPWGSIVRIDEVA